MLTIAFGLGRDSTVIDIEGHVTSASITSISYVTKDVLTQDSSARCWSSLLDQGSLGRSDRFALPFSTNVSGRRYDVSFTQAEISALAQLTSSWSRAYL
jgi:hypothetical protein